MVERKDTQLFRKKLMHMKNISLKKGRKGGFLTKMN